MRRPTLIDRLKSSEFTALLAIVVLSSLFYMGNPNFLTLSLIHI